MTNRNSNDYDPVAAAARLNAKLAARVAQWKRTRLVATILFVALGIGVLFNRYTMVFSPPCWIAAFIAFLLYWDSRAQLREVLSRRDATPTPRIRGLGNSPLPPQSASHAAFPKA